MSRWNRDDRNHVFGAIVGAAAALVAGLLAWLGLGGLFRRRRQGEPAPPDGAPGQGEPAATPRRDHERSDIRVGAVLALALGMIVAAVVLHAALYWLFDYFATSAARSDTPPPALALTPQPPPEPRLQAAPSDDLQQLRAREDATLHSYGWVDRDSGVVRIPIDRAIDLVAERGLPARSQQR